MSTTPSSSLRTGLKVASISFSQNLRTLSIITTEADLRQSLFGDHRYAKVIIGYYEGNPVCFALFFHIVEPNLKELVLSLIQKYFKKYDWKLHYLENLQA